MATEQLASYDWKAIVSKIVIATALAYAIFIVVTCPCSPVLACHVPLFFLAIAVAVVVAVATLLSG